MKTGRPLVPPTARAGRTRHRSPRAPGSVMAGSCRTAGTREVAMWRSHLHERRDLLLGEGLVLVGADRAVGELARNRRCHAFILIGGREQMGNALGLLRWRQTSFPSPSPPRPARLSNLLTGPGAPAFVRHPRDFQRRRPRTRSGEEPRTPSFQLHGAKERLRAPVLPSWAARAGTSSPTHATGQGAGPPPAGLGAYGMSDFLSMTSSPSPRPGPGPPGRAPRGPFLPGGIVARAARHRAVQTSSHRLSPVLLGSPSTTG